MTKTRILLADDHAMLRTGIKMLVNAEDDMEVVGEAGSGIEALRAAASLRPDVITLDLSMPGGGGLELLSKLREVAPDGFVIVLTMHDDTAYLRTAIAQGAMGYVVKTSAEEVLLTAIRTVRQGRIYVDAKLREPSANSQPAPAGAKAPAGEANLSDRERQVLRLLALGHTNREIGEQLYISPKTVETYRGRIGEKLGLTSRADFVRFGIETGISRQSGG